jgi:hypothetical protein
VQYGQVAEVKLSKSTTLSNAIPEENKTPDSKNSAKSDFKPTFMVIPFFNFVLC